MSEVGWIAAVEVTRRQEFIARTDRLQEMVGGSEMIADSVKVAESLAKKSGGKVSVVWPVSGVVRLYSTDLGALAKLLWQLREKLVYEYGLPLVMAILPVNGETTFTDVFNRELEVKMRERKNSPGGMDGSPAHPLFARCLLQPDLPANQWSPDEARDDRRSLLNRYSHERRKISSEKYISRFSHVFDSFNVNQLPHSQDDLVVGKSDSYVALIKADADGLGSIIANRKFQKPDDARTFATNVQKWIGDSLKEAIREYANKKWLLAGKLPVIPIVQAGEDLWLLCARHIAFPIALALMEKFQKEAKCVEAGLTISTAIVFTKKGYPMDARLRLAGQLLQHAKNRRRDEIALGGAVEGYLDYLWLESTTRPDLDRERPLLEDGEGLWYRLHKRPWSSSQAKMIYKAASMLVPPAGDAPPRRKLNQLGQLLHLGPLADTAYQGWRSRLTEQQRDLFDAALKKVQLHNSKSSIWDYREGARVTGLAELVELTEILRLTEE